MKRLRFTLLSDGSSDRALIPILRWLLVKSDATASIQPEWADLRWLRRAPQGLANRTRTALEFYPCDILFIHRDAEGQSIDDRIAEINGATEDLEDCPVICVVPVRMMEAWLLFDEQAIRRAAGNPLGRQPLNLPRLRDVEAETNPKEVLYSALRMASGLTGRRLRRFHLGASVHRVADLINDFSPLQTLPGFNRLERSVEEIVQRFE